MGGLGEGWVGGLGEGWGVEGEDGSIEEIGDRFKIATISNLQGLGWGGRGN